MRWPQPMCPAAAHVPGRGPWGAAAQPGVGQEGPGVHQTWAELGHTVARSRHMLARIVGQLRPSFARRRPYMWPDLDHWPRCAQDARPSQRAARSAPPSAPAGPGATPRVEVIQFRSKLAEGHIRQKSAQAWQILGAGGRFRCWPRLVKIDAKLGGVGQNLGDDRTELADVGRTRPKFGHPWPEFRQVRPLSTSAQVRTISTGVGPIWQKLCLAWGPGQETKLSNGTGEVVKK